MTGEIALPGGAEEIFAFPEDQTPPQSETELPPLEGGGNENPDVQPKLKENPDPLEWEIDLARELFHATHPFHGLGSNELLLLELAIRLLPDADQATRLRKPSALQHNIRKLVSAQTSLQAAVGEEKNIAEWAGRVEKELLAVVTLWRTTEQGREGAGNRRVSLNDLGLRFSAKRTRELHALAGLLAILHGLDSSQTRQTKIRNVLRGGGKRGFPLVGRIFQLEGPQAAQDAAQAQRCSRLWTRAGYPVLLFTTADEQDLHPDQIPSLSSLLKGADIDPCDSIAEAGRKVMRFQFAEMLRHEAGTRLGEDIEALHDMRVATRRMRAAVEVFGDAFEPKILKRHLKGLRAVGRALGRVRDLDVLLEKAGKYLNALPDPNRQELDPLLDYWRRKRAEARTAMLDHLNSEAYREFKTSFSEFLNSPGEGVLHTAGGTPVPRQVRELAPAMIYTRLAAVRAYDQILEHASIEQMHALRIEFKKLRYTIEFFREALGCQARMVIEELKKVQDHLGDLNDAHVATQILRAFLDEWDKEHFLSEDVPALPIGERQDVQGVVNYLAARYAERHALMLSFRETWKNFCRAEFRRNLARAVAVL